MTCTGAADPGVLTMEYQPRRPGDVRRYPSPETNARKSTDAREPSDARRVVRPVLRPPHIEDPGLASHPLKRGLINNDTSEVAPMISSDLNVLSQPWCVRSRSAMTATYLLLDCSPAFPLSGITMRCTGATPLRDAGGSLRDYTAGVAPFRYPVIADVIRIDGHRKIPI